MTRQLFAESHDAVVSVVFSVQQKKKKKLLQKPPLQGELTGKVLQLDTNDGWKYLKCEIHSDPGIMDDGNAVHFIVNVVVQKLGCFKTLCTI